MAKIEKDQFEEFIKNNMSHEEPSPEVFTNLQREASWNQPTGGSNSGGTVLRTILVVALMALFVYFLSADKHQNPVEDKNQSVPAEEVIEVRPINIIAQTDAEFETGIFKLLKCRSDDFNLSFAEDENNQTVLGFARELNNT